jgi:hypothetical protein
MNYKKPSEKGMRELLELVKQIESEVSKAQTKADEMGILSASKSLGACEAVLSRLDESLSDQ